MAENAASGGSLPPEGQSSPDLVLTRPSTCTEKDIGWWKDEIVILSDRPNGCIQNFWNHPLKERVEPRKIAWYCY